MNDGLEFTVGEVAAKLQSADPPRLLDIRDPGEWEIAHLEGGQLVTQELMDEVLNEWEKTTQIVCYCHHGIRSLQAAAFLRQKGFSDVYSMKGGIDLWAQEIDPAINRY